MNRRQFLAGNAVAGIAAATGAAVAGLPAIPHATGIVAEPVAPGSTVIHFNGLSVTPEQIRQLVQEINDLSRR